MSNGAAEIAEMESMPDPNTEETKFAKPKKKTCRRGKKRKFKSHDATSDEPAAEDTSEMFWHSETAECKKRDKDVLIRPVDAPNAPKNSTQFIMDDHDECHLYLSFETPNPYHPTSGTTEPVNNCNNNVDYEDAAFQDIDYVYHSLQDLDSTAYYLKDFESSYSNMRFEELLRLQKSELMTALETLENRTKEMETKLYEQDPSSALEQLQQKLLQLQEENTLLHNLNDHLKSLVQNLEPHDAQVHDDPLLHEEMHSCSEQSCDGCENCCDDDSCSETHPTTDDLDLDQDASIYYIGGKDFQHLPIEESTSDSTQLQANSKDGSEQLSSSECIIESKGNSNVSHQVDCKTPESEKLSAVSLEDMNHASQGNPNG